ncbi:stage II sporulation protein E [Pseudogracilibacillus auburnensis]|uniref:stage II sporulation protein E n=1 Tax=Pseudogracilibacillus auburnensis TaxID=1494959 RepID=UPI001A961DB7|nr:stage II sporulation protein E [Pseudogracilibacillus auburnensis]MBO1004710.1 stage II sporulation protein E [Pseudogracilibacillus auburnensis]
MGRVERSVVEPTVDVNLNGTSLEISAGVRKAQQKAEHFLVQKGIALLFIAILLGRALILSHLTPFALPFFAAVYIIRRDKAPLMLFGLLIGSITLSFGHAFYTLMLCLLFLLSFKIVKQLVKSPVKSLPYVIAGLTFVMKFGYQYINDGFVFSWYSGLMAGIEAGLGFVLVFIFLQSIPLFTPLKSKRALKTEEVISLIIMLASIMTGTIGWTVYQLSVEHILSRYLVILFAFIAGATVGSTVGVVTGLIFSLASISSLFQMSLLAFSGLLGGLLKEGKRFGTAFGLVVATLLIGMYTESTTPLLITMYESGIAILLLLLTPISFTEKLARHIPGTPEHAQEQQRYARKIRDITVRRVEQFSSVFQALSNSFSQTEKWRETINENEEFDYFLSNVTEKTCDKCHKKNQCWGADFDKTYELMKSIMHEIDDQTGRVPASMYRKLEKHCIKPTNVRNAIHQELNVYMANEQLKKQVKESRKLVAEQLLGVSEVMGDFAREIQREQESHHRQEEMVMDALMEFGIEIDQVEIFSMEPGNIDIDIAIPNYQGFGECEKIIAPLLSDILKENIIVQNEEFLYESGFCYGTFRSAKAYVVETGVAHAAKGGGFLSGDSYSTIELGPGKYAVAISDGMGNGERAHYESSETLKLLQKILKSGIEEMVAIKSINSILSLRTTDEIFSTLDLAVIDMQDAHVKCLKIGSTPSFIKRGNRIIKIEAGNLPMGILQEFDVDVVTKQLRAGDTLIMMSDGVFEGPKHVENYDVWMMRKLREIETDDPQSIADLVMEEVIRTRSGVIADDMTVLVVQIKHNTPKWAAIPVRYRNKQIS